VTPWWRLTARPRTRAAPAEGRGPGDHASCPGAPRFQGGQTKPHWALWDERVLRESTDGHGSESPSAPALCAMCIFARCNGITVTGCKPPPDRIVASWVRRSLGTCNKTRRHGPSGVLDSRKGRQGGYRRAHTCMLFQQCRNEAYRQVASRRALTQVRPPARARIANPTHLCSITIEMPCRVEVGIPFGRRRLGRGL
jgi:hypothetical protein